MLATPEDEMAGTMSFASLTDAVAVGMVEWSAHARNIVRLLITRFLNMVTLVKTQRIFLKHFNIARHGKVPCRSTIQLRVENFRTSASGLEKKPADSATATED
jgi:hypothetical protein